MYKIDIDREDFYLYNEPKERTRERLIQIAEMGMEEIGFASFGIRGIMSGLYIEKIWRYTEEDWADYINWVNELRRKNNLIE